MNPGPSTPSPRIQGVSHYENFPVASVLCPPRLRPAIAAIYWFARTADDIADEGNASAQARLDDIAAYRADLMATAAGLAPSKRWSGVFERLGPVMVQFALPVNLLADLLSAFEQDVVKQRYDSEAELLDYCRRSANPVGRLLLHLYRATEPRNLAWSDDICTSLQLINFWQDIEIDYRKNRLYLPADEMAKYAVTESQIANRNAGSNWRDLMLFQIDRTRRMLQAGAPLGRTLPGRIGLELRMIVMGGNRILEKLQAGGGDVFRDRPVLRPFDWVLTLYRSLFAYR